MFGEALGQPTRKALGLTDVGRIPISIGRSPTEDVDAGAVIIGRSDGMNLKPVFLAADTVPNDDGGVVNPIDRIEG
jgi:hypothetical protein